MGHEVHQKPVEFDDDISDYDDVFVYIAGPRQLVTTKLFNGLMAIAKRPDCILLMDDWQVADLFKGVIKCLDDNELFAPFILNVNKKNITELLPYKNDFNKAINIIADKSNRMLISAFNVDHLNNKAGYGAHLLFSNIKYPSDLLFTYNPNPYHRNRKPGDIQHDGIENPHFNGTEVIPKMGIHILKRKRFNFASLVQSKTQKWLKKQGYINNPEDIESGFIGTWRVDLYGSRAESQKRLTEDEMCKIFQQDWGCLMPGYDHAGSGWWRSRPLQTADANCILIGDKKEISVFYGDKFPLLDLKAADLIVATDADLNDIANDQHKALYFYHPLDKKYQQHEIISVLKAKR